MDDVLEVTQIISEAQSAYRRGNYQAALRSFLAAEESFRTRGDVVRAAEMINNQSVALLKIGENQAAYDVLAPTIAVFQESGDTRFLAMAYGNQAAALAALGEKEEAILKYQIAAEQFKRDGEDDLYTHTMQSFSTLQLRTGKPLEALASMRSGVNKIRHPKLKHRLLQKLLDLPFCLLNR